MKVIMLSNIEKVGRKGDVVNVKRGFARNYLIPRDFAIYATPANMARLSSIQTKAAEEESQRVAEMQKIADRIGVLKLAFIRKVDEHDHMFGSVSESDISNALAEQGITVHKSLIHMEKHIKELGETTIQLRLHKDVTAYLRILVEKEGGNEPTPLEVAVSASPVVEESPAVMDEENAEPIDEILEPEADATEEPVDVITEDNNEE
jgi:large subunit ribosomal protein L9